MRHTSPLLCSVIHVTQLWADSPYSCSLREVWNISAIWLLTNQILALLHHCNWQHPAICGIRQSQHFLTFLPCRPCLLWVVVLACFHVSEVSTVTLVRVYVSHIFIHLSLFSRLHPCSTEEPGIFSRTAEESGAGKGESLICCNEMEQNTYCVTVAADIIKHFVANN